MQLNRAPTTRNRPLAPAGFTLIEILVAAGVLGLILLALGGMFTVSSRALTTTEQASDRQQEAETATQLLRYEIGLAGYHGTGATDLTTNTFAGQPTLVITEGASDAITVRYYEDRLFDGTGNDALTTVTFSVKEADGVKSLFRREGDLDAPSVPGVEKLKVVRLVYRDQPDDTTPPFTTIDAEQLTGISVQLTFDDGRAGIILIGFDNAQENPSVVAASGP